MESLYQHYESGAGPGSFGDYEPPTGAKNQQRQQQQSQANFGAESGATAASSDLSLHQKRQQKSLSTETMAKRARITKTDQSGGLVERLIRQCQLKNWRVKWDEHEVTAKSEGTDATSKPLAKEYRITLSIPEQNRDYSTTLRGRRAAKEECAKQALRELFGLSDVELARASVRRLAVRLARASNEGAALNEFMQHVEHALDVEYETINGNAPPPHSYRALLVFNGETLTGPPANSKAAAKTALGRIFFPHFYHCTWEEIHEWAADQDEAVATEMWTSGPPYNAWFNDLVTHHNAQTTTNEPLRVQWAETTLTDSSLFEAALSVDDETFKGKGASKRTARTSAVHQAMVTLWPDMLMTLENEWKRKASAYQQSAAGKCNSLGPTLNVSCGGSLRMTLPSPNALTSMMQQQEQQRQRQCYANDGGGGMGLGDRIATFANAEFGAQCRAVPVPPGEEVVSFSLRPDGTLRLLTLGPASEIVYVREAAAAPPPTEEGET